MGEVVDDTHHLVLEPLCRPGGKPEGNRLVRLVEIVDVAEILGGCPAPRPLLEDFFDSRVTSRPLRAHHEEIEVGVADIDGEPQRREAALLTDQTAAGMRMLRPEGEPLRVASLPQSLRSQGSGHFFRHLPSF